MRNTLQEQYNLIKEGKGSKNMFMKTALRQFPNLVTPTLGFDMTVNILKQRQVISETAGGVVTKGIEQDWVKLFKENIEKLNESMDLETAKAEAKKISQEEGVVQHVNEVPGGYKVSDWYDADITVCSYENGMQLNEEESLTEDENEDKKTFWWIMIEKDGKKFYLKNAPYFSSEDEAHAYAKEKNVKNYTLKSREEKVDKDGRIISEAKEVKAKVSKTDADIIKKETQGYDYKNKSKENIDNLYGQEFLLGYYTEMKDPKNTEKSVDELKKIVAKNLSSDPSYYVKKGQFGVKDLGYTDTHPGLGPTKEVKGKYKSSGMEPVKIKESIIKKIDFLIKEGLDLKEIEKVAEVAALEAKMAKVTKEKEKREKKIKALETLAEMDKEVVSKEGLNTLKKEIKLLEKMAGDIQKKMDKHAGVKKEVVTDTAVSEENLDNMSETEETEN